MPLVSRADAAAIRSSEASSPNSAFAATSRLVAAGASAIFHLREAPVGERYGHRSLADRRGAPLDRAAAHVARGEHAGNIGLQWHWFPGQRPVTGEPIGSFAASHQIADVV